MNAENHSGNANMERCERLQSTHEDGLIARVVPHWERERLHYVVRLCGELATARGSGPRGAGQHSGRSTASTRAAPVRRRRVGAPFFCA